MDCQKSENNFKPAVILRYWVVSPSVSYRRERAVSLKLNLFPPLPPGVLIKIFCGTLIAPILVFYSLWSMTSHALTDILIS